MQSFPVGSFSYLFQSKRYLARSALDNPCPWTKNLSISSLRDLPGTIAPEMLSGKSLNRNVVKDDLPDVQTIEVDDSAVANTFDAELEAFLADDNIGHLNNDAGNDTMAASGNEDSSSEYETDESNAS